MSGEPGSIPCIDGHAHVFHRGLRFAPGRRYTPPYDATLEAYLAMLDANGFVAGVLVQPSFLGTDNSFLLGALAREPDRLRGVAVVAPETPADALRALADEGVVGLRLNLVGQPTPDLSDAPWPAFLHDAATLGFHIEIQAEAHRLLMVIPSLLRSNVPALVIDHFGLPDRTLGAQDPAFDALLAIVARADRRVWMKVSAPYRLGPQGAATAAALMPRIVAAFGLDRLVFGTDWPHTQHEGETRVAEARAALAAWFPAETDRRVVGLTAGTALFGF